MGSGREGMAGIGSVVFCEMVDQEGRGVREEQLDG